MKFLWSGDMKINTVHVNDVVKALFHLCNHGDDGATYNLADKSNTGTLSSTPNLIRSQSATPSPPIR
jgi:nucleoside-diphosphate-sugar epimerase